MHYSFRTFVSDVTLDRYLLSYECVFVLRKLNKNGIFTLIFIGLIGMSLWTKVEILKESHILSLTFLINKQNVLAGFWIYIYFNMIIIHTFT